MIIFVIISISLAIGFFLNPVERGLSFIIVAFINQINKNFSSKGKEFQNKFFTSQLMLEEDYSKLLEWFFSNTNERSHWEWELFHYYVYWSIFLNFAIFSGCILYLLRGDINYFEVILILIANLAILYFALLRCQVMSNVHNLYIKKTKSETK